MSEENPEMREMAARICRDYLHGVWKHVTAENMTLKRISGGLSNWLYNVQLPDGAVPIRGEPRQVLLRLYGQIHGERALEGLITESVIFTLLSERRLGPKLHGIFPGGRIEEYIPARPLLTDELADPILSCMIAEKMAQIHSMQVPISKEPTWLWDTMTKWLDTTTDILENIEDVDVRHLKNVNAIRAIDLDHEIKWFRSLATRHKYPVVFCHNDMQEGNILLRQNTRKPELVLIDFEYCSYNYRAFDIANHFVEWQYDYTAAEYPFFHERAASGPTKEQKVNIGVFHLSKHLQRKNHGKIVAFSYPSFRRSTCLAPSWRRTNELHTYKIPPGIPVTVTPRLLHDPILPHRSIHFLIDYIYVHISIAIPWNCVHLNDDTYILNAFQKTNRNREMYSFEILRRL
ncbi:choline/ethanolamine kinase isoform X2 [Bombus terrestris]|nr:choline/ethanolamine kinase isoform X2 [Bombus terrestris]XP_048267138.1 choline/ethanolamine kinase isoform X2 [Bombus terrestris]XP_048267139.1 choline/ethanolamine kinase isoform X2 [Bombus terrestris]XP_048267141.1 choline/ethanolamine kinase isoform X2 [Bombus terrestris]